MASESKPILLCFDRSRAAAGAIAEAGRLMGPRRALAVTAWVSVAPEVDFLEGMPSELSGNVEDVVAQLDARARRLAEEVAAEGDALARAAGFRSEPLALRVPAPLAGHAEAGVAQAIVQAADEHDAAAVVLGSRGLSQMEAAVLGSVSYGIVHQCRRPLMIVPDRWPE